MSFFSMQPNSFALRSSLPTRQVQANAGMSLAAGIQSLCCAVDCVRTIRRVAIEVRPEMSAGVAV